MKTLHRRMAACGVVLAAAGCGASPITSARIERAVAPTFANLVEAQLSQLGLARLPASDITVTASCRKVTAGTTGAGAGDWICTLVWHGPNSGVMRDTYDLAVAADGCYSATVDSAEAQLGGPTIADAAGRERKNLLYSFEGCFDTT